MLARFCRPGGGLTSSELLTLFMEFIWGQQEERRGTGLKPNMARDAEEEAERKCEREVPSCLMTPGPLPLSSLSFVSFRLTPSQNLSLHTHTRAHRRRHMLYCESVSAWGHMLLWEGRELVIQVFLMCVCARGGCVLTICWRMGNMSCHMWREGQF